MRTDIFYQQALITIFLVCAILLTGCDRQPIEEKQINVVFRFDDYSALSSTDMELRIIDAFRKNQASITFGVIPFVVPGKIHDPSPKDIVPLTSNKGDILKTASREGIVDVALHGYSHQSISAQHQTEFAGLDYDSQVEKLRKGKDFLEEIIDAPVTTFVPPWERYDLNTLRALEKLGFTTLSASDVVATEDTKLSFLPASCGLPRIRDAVDAARSSSDNQPVIVVLFHAYDFQEINEKRGTIRFREFEDLLSWLKSQDDVRLLSIGQASKVLNDLSAKRFLLAQRNYSLSRFLPSSLREQSSSLYIESPNLLKTRLKVGGFYFAIVSLGALLSFMVGIVILPRSAFIINIVKFGSIVLLIIILIYAFHDRQVHIKGMMVSAGVIGASIGLCLCVLYLKKKRFWDRNSMGERD